MHVLARVGTPQEVTEDDERDFERFMLPSAAPSRSLASIIMQKIQVPDVTQPHGYVLRARVCMRACMIA
jgi:hypothetical protein